MATSFFSEISYYFKRILSKINKFYLIWIQEIVFFVLVTTVKPVLSGHRIKRTVAEVPKFISPIYFK